MVPPQVPLQLELSVTEEVTDGAGVGAPVHGVHVVLQRGLGPAVKNISMKES